MCILQWLQYVLISASMHIYCNKGEKTSTLTLYAGTVLEMCMLCEARMDRVIVCYRWTNGYYSYHCTMGLDV